MLDNKDANIPFKFILEEVDSSGKYLKMDFQKKQLMMKMEILNLSNIIYNSEGIHYC